MTLTHFPPFFPLSFLFILSTLLLYPATAQVAIPRFTDCFSGSASLKLNISTVYAQITTSESLGRHLKLTLLANSPQVIKGTANGSSDLGAFLILIHLVSPGSLNALPSYLVLYYGVIDVQYT
jgi:hypothetical protein